MKFDIQFKLKGPAGEIWVPNRENPVEAKGLHAVLEQLTQFFEEESALLYGVEIIGLKIEEIDNGSTED